MTASVGVPLAFLLFLSAWLAHSVKIMLFSHRHEEAPDLQSRPVRSRLLEQVVALDVWKSVSTALGWVVAALTAGASLSPLVAAAALVGLGVVLGVFTLFLSPVRLFQARTPGPGTCRVAEFLCGALGPLPGWLVHTGRLLSPGYERTISEAQLREMVDQASAAESIEGEEAELITSALELDQTLVRSVMVPRTDMVFIHRDESTDAALRLFIRSGYSRVPVIGATSDEVLGILYLKDLVAALHQWRVSVLPPFDASTSSEELSVLHLARPVRYVPDSKPVGELLRELQRESTHVAIVVDEYGGTSGLVTLEDLIEELVGEIVDEYDVAAPATEQLGPGRYRVSAQMAVTDVGELFDRELDDDDVDTIGGLLTKHLGRVPIAGSAVETDGLRLCAERLEGRRNRISTLIVERIEQPRTDGAPGAKEPEHDMTQQEALSEK